MSESMLGIVAILGIVFVTAAWDVLGRWIKAYQFNRGVLADVADLNRRLVAVETKTSNVADKVTAISMGTAPRRAGTFAPPR